MSTETRVNNNQEVTTPPSTSSSNENALLLESLVQLPGEELSSVLMAYNASWEGDDDDDDDEEEEETPTTKNDEQQNSNKNNNDDDDENDQHQHNKKSAMVTFDLSRTAVAEFSSTEFEAAQKAADDFFKNHSDDFLEKAARKFESFEYEIIDEIQKQESEGESSSTLNDGEEESGMTATMKGDGAKSIFDSFTRTHSDIGAESDEWILEKISLSRKVPRSMVPDHDDEDYEDMEGDDLDEYDENVSGRKLTQKFSGSKQVVQFLCHWKYYDEPTWETRGALAKLGFADDIITFEKDEIEKMKERQRLSRLVGGKSIDPALKFGQFSSRSSYRSTIFEGIFRDWKEFILKKCEESNLTVKGIANCAPSYAAAEFLRHWQAYRDQGTAKVPMRVFHGTRANLISAICKNSLAVPGSRGAKIVNANAFGTGIYTSKNTSTPASYSDGNCMMFCCVVLVGKQYETVPADHRKKPPDHFVIVRENHLVVPVWLIHFARRPWNDCRSTESDKEKERAGLQPFQFYGSWQELALVATRNNTGYASDHNVTEYIPQNRPEDVVALSPKHQSKKNQVSKHALKKFIADRAGTKFVQHKSTRMMRQLPKAMKDLVMDSWKKEKQTVNDKNDD